jgi:mono/diheme cytochrome c family protein
MTARATPTRTAIALTVALGALGALACRPATPARTAAITRTAIPATGDVVGLVELGDALYVFARDQVTIERAGAAVATVPAPGQGWAEAIVMPALDEPGRWVVARTRSGELWRITASGDLEPIHDRLGVPPRVRSIAASAFAPSAASGAASGAAPNPTSSAASASTVVIALDDGIAILRDQAHVARFTGPSGTVIASRDRIAIRHGDQLEVWSLVDQTRTSYRVPGAIAAAFTGAPGRGTLVVATHDALFVEAANTLRRLAAPELLALAAAGSRLWVATARGVELLDGAALVPTGMRATATDHLFGLASGDVVVGGSTQLARLAIDRPADDPRWRATVLPIFERVCARCHRPGGDAGVDLSTAAAWRRERDELVHRVVATHTMPPAGIALDAADRRVLAGWLAH